MQSWGARIKAILNGDIDGGDLQALLAATAPLEGLRRAEADRRLDAEIGHLGQEWQAALILAPIAGPLWLADALITVAGALIDAEAEAHPGQAVLMSALSHRTARAMLEAVGPLLLDAGSSLADAGYRSTTRLPLSVGRMVAPADQGLTAAYVHGLQLAADRLIGATSQMLQTTSALVTRSPAPTWLAGGLQRLQDEIAALNARLDILRAQGAALLAHQGTDVSTLRAQAVALWESIERLLQIGQFAAVPSLLPGATAPVPAMPPKAPAARPASVAPPAAAPPAAAVPPPAAPPEEPRPLPAIDGGRSTAGMTPAPRQRDSAVREGEAPHALPEIAPSHPAAERRGTAHTLPEIGKPAPTPGVGKGDSRPEETDDTRSLPRIEAPRAGATSEGTRRSEPGPAPGSPHERTHGASEAQQVEHKNRWLLSSQATRHRLRRAGLEEAAEQNLDAFWEQRHWTLSAAAATYLDQTTMLAGAGAIAQSGRSLKQAPYAPIYRVQTAQVTVLGQVVSSGTLLAFDYGQDRLLTPGPRDGLED